MKKIGRNPPSTPELRILNVLQASEKPLCGAEIVRQSGGWVSRGHVYASLSRLDEKKMVCSSTTSQKPFEAAGCRTTYSLTPLGYRILELIEQIDSEVEG